MDDIDGARWNRKSDFLAQIVIDPTNELPVCCVSLPSETLEIPVI